MSNLPEENIPLDAERIAEMADAGQSVSRFFTNSGTMVQPPKIQRVNVDFTLPMLQELDRAAQELNVSRQAIIKSLLRQSLDQHYLASARQSREVVRSSQFLGFEASPSPCAPGPASAMISTT